MSDIDWDIFHFGKDDPRDHYRGSYHRTHGDDFDYSNGSSNMRYNGEEWVRKD
ncbi:MAG TPA: hypothetical protein VFE65_00265 [Pseudonocardia sp.]|nr:hypothetical protein [Pseudonocardia sp.]